MRRGSKGSCVLIPNVDGWEVVAGDGSTSTTDSSSTLSLLPAWNENARFVYAIFLSFCSPPCPEVGTNLASKIIANISLLCRKEIVELAFHSVWHTATGHVLSQPKAVV